MSVKALWIGIMAISLCSYGCGFRGEVKKTETGYKWNSNRACHIKTPEGFETDGKGQPISVPITGMKVGSTGL